MGVRELKTDEKIWGIKCNESQVNDCVLKWKKGNLIWMQKY